MSSDSPPASFARPREMHAYLSGISVAAGNYLRELEASLSRHRAHPASYQDAPSLIAAEGEFYAALRQDRANSAPALDLATLNSLNSEAGEIEAAILRDHPDLAPAQDLPSFTSVIDKDLPSYDADVFPPKYDSTEHDLLMMIFHEIRRRVAERNLLQQGESADAAVVYMIVRFVGSGLISSEKVCECRGVQEHRLRSAYRVMYKHRSHLIDPEWIARGYGKMEHLPPCHFWTRRLP